VQLKPGMVEPVQGLAGQQQVTGLPAVALLLAGDDIIFNTAGIITFSTMTGNVSYNSLSILQGTVTLAHTGGTTLTLGGAIQEMTL
jgi:hypothetical protein